MQTPWHVLFDAGYAIRVPAIDARQGFVSKGSASRRPNLPALNVILVSIAARGTTLMANAGNHRAGPEHRRKARQQIHYRASILLEDDPAPRSCAIADISESGAKVTLDSAEELPEQFILLLTSTGSARRLCQVVWRTGATVGVKFVRDID
jgi:hypothetical protein